MPRAGKGVTKGLVLRNPEFKGHTQAFRAYFGVLVSNAIRRGVDFNLSVDDVYRLSKSACHYCGAKPAVRQFGGNTKYTEPFNGIDRLNSDGAYDEENAVPACKICNRIKYVSTVEEYLTHARRLVAFNAPKP